MLLRAGLWRRRHACTSCRGRSLFVASGTLSLPDGQRVTCVCRWHDDAMIAVGISFRRGRSYALQIAVHGPTAHVCALAAPPHWNLASALGAPAPGAELSQDIATIARMLLEALSVDFEVIEVAPESSDHFARAVCALERPSSPPPPLLPLLDGLES